MQYSSLSLSLSLSLSPPLSELVKDSSLEIPDSPNVALIGLTFLGGSQVSEMSVLSLYSVPMLLNCKVKSIKENKELNWRKN
jgi:hypothetical protein